MAGARIVGVRARRVLWAGRRHRAAPGAPNVGHCVPLLDGLAPLRTQIQTQKKLGGQPEGIKGGEKMGEVRMGVRLRPLPMHPLGAAAGGVVRALQGTNESCVKNRSHKN